MVCTTDFDHRILCCFRRPSIASTRPPDCPACPPLAWACSISQDITIRVHHADTDTLCTQYHDIWGSSMNNIPTNKSRKSKCFMPSSERTSCNSRFRLGAPRSAIRPDFILNIDQALGTGRVHGCLGGRCPDTVTSCHYFNHEYTYTTDYSNRSSPTKKIGRSTTVHNNTVVGLCSEITAFSRWVLGFSHPVPWSDFIPTPIGACAGPLPGFTCLVAGARSIKSSV